MYVFLWNICNLGRSNVVALQPVHLFPHLMVMWSKSPSWPRYFKIIPSFLVDSLNWGPWKVWESKGCRREIDHITHWVMYKNKGWNHVFDIPDSIGKGTRLLMFVFYTLLKCYFTLHSGVQWQVDPSTRSYEIPWLDFPPPPQSCFSVQIHILLLDVHLQIEIQVMSGAILSSLPPSAC